MVKYRLDAEVLDLIRNEIPSHLPELPIHELDNVVCVIDVNYLI